MKTLITHYATAKEDTNYIAFLKYGHIIDTEILTDFEYNGPSDIAQVRRSLAHTRKLCNTYITNKKSLDRGQRYYIVRLRNNARFFNLSTDEYLDFVEYVITTYGIESKHMLYYTFIDVDSIIKKGPGSEIYLDYDRCVLRYNRKQTLIKVPARFQKRPHINSLENDPEFKVAILEGLTSNSILNTITNKGNYALLQSLTDRTIIGHNKIVKAKNISAQLIYKPETDMLYMQSNSHRKLGLTQPFMNISFNRLSFQDAMNAMTYCNYYPICDHTPYIKNSNGHLVSPCDISDYEDTIRLEYDTFMIRSQFVFFKNIVKNQCKLYGYNYDDIEKATNITNDFTIICEKLDKHLDKFHSDIDAFLNEDIQGPAPFYSHEAHSMLMSLSQLNDKLQNTYRLLSLMPALLSKCLESPDCYEDKLTNYLLLANELVNIERTTVGSRFVGIRNIFKSNKIDGKEILTNMKLPLNDQLIDEIENNITSIKAVYTLSKLNLRLKEDEVFDYYKLISNILASTTTEDDDYVSINFKNSNRPISYTINTSVSHDRPVESAIINTTKVYTKCKERRAFLESLHINILSNAKAVSDLIDASSFIVAYRTSLDWTAFKTYANTNSNYADPKTLIDLLDNTSVSKHRDLFKEDPVYCFC